MNNLPNIFDYNGKQVRVVVKDGEPWFVAKDVCEVLELVGDPGQHLRRLDNDEKGLITIQTLGGPQEMSIINEPGLYSLILTSRKPEAKQFKRWVTHEVIPSIRKHGAYMTPDTIEKALSDPDFIISLATRLKEERQARLAAEQKVEEFRPKVEMYDILMDGDNCQTVGEVAKAFGWGRNRLFKLLRDKGILMKNNLPYQQYIDDEYFEVREVSITRGDSVINVTQTLVTPKGIDFIGKILREEGIIFSEYDSLPDRDVSTKWRRRLSSRYLESYET